MLTQQQVSERLQDRGIDVTQLRLSIAEAIYNSPDPLSVQQIHAWVVSHSVSTSAGSIKSALAVLKKSGLIHKLSYQGCPRYKANLESHIDLVCTQCGSVVDTEIGQESVYQLRKRISSQSNFQVVWQQVGFYGR
jgi:Fe2+ or Zn2+ uptake regulation protein